MKVCYLGDVHAHFETAEQTLRAAEEREGPFDLVIQVGDFGYWPRLYPDRSWRRENPPSRRHVWIDGNHEDHEMLKRMTPGELLWDVWEYVPRGTVRDGILFLGGARSIDAHSRLMGRDWFPEEELTAGDMYRALYAAEAAGGVHTVVSHDCPISFNIPYACQAKRVNDSTRGSLQVILEELKPLNWFFGHYHQGMSGVQDGCTWRCVGITEEGDYVVQEV